MPIKIKVNNSSSSIHTNLRDNTSEIVSSNKDQLSIIKTKVKPSETIKIKPTDNSDEVKMRSSCDINSKKLELEIKDEARTREAADKKLEQQIRNITIKGVNVDNKTIILNDNSEISLNELLNGGYLVVETLSERNAIPQYLLKKGTIVRVSQNKILYEWTGNKWEETPVNILSIGSGLQLSTAGDLSVETTNEVANKNSLPVTSQGVYNVTSNITENLWTHINNMTVHITAKERSDWNSKVTAEVEDDPDSDDLILVFKN